jgi:hypothetical protein
MKILKTNPIRTGNVILVRAHGSAGHKQMLRIAANLRSATSVYCCFDKNTLHRSLAGGSEWTEGQLGDYGFCGIDLVRAVRRNGKLVRK